MNLLSILDGTPEPPIIDLHLESINESGEYDLPTPMYEFQKELTDQIVSLHYPDILKYCETNDTRELITKSLEICIENCMLVSTHPYLLINHYMPKNLASKDMSSKLAETSGKFKVLKDLVSVIISNSAAKSTKNVGVVMKNVPRFFDLTEALLLGCTGNKSIKRYVGNHVRKESAKASKNSANNNNNNHHTNGSGEIHPTHIHLIPQDGKIAKHQDLLESTRFDVLIIFDGSVDTESDFFKGLRTQNRRGEAIIIRMIPMRTIEHCQLYYSRQKHDKHYLYKLISSIVCLRDQVGNLPPDIFPIFNQNLKYLSTNFFDDVFKTSSRSGSLFPAWPLPELPSIPWFSATDVERSLLTEVHFHYTPYDSADNVIDYTPVAKKESKKTYYESKRLESDYVTNPLKNDFNKLIGIYSNDSNIKTSQRDEINKVILTHRLIMQLNNAYMNLDIVNEEHIAYLDFNEQERQEKHGRREMEYKTTLSKICDDLDHTQHRITIAEKQASKKSQKIEITKQENIELSQRLEGFIKDNDISDDKQQTFVENQAQIWDLRKKISDTLQKIKSKNDEKSYMSKEFNNAILSINDSKVEIASCVEKNEELKRKFQPTLDLDQEEDQNYKKQKRELKEQISAAKDEREALKSKLARSMKFLRDTSHLKKRKGRGLTPSTK